MLEAARREAARREAAQGLPFVDDALLAHQKLIEIWVRRQVVDAPLQTKPSQKQMYG